MTLSHRFKWDETKNQSNVRDHRISFEEACHIFDRPVFTRIDTREYDELREISLGTLGSGVVLVVVHTERQGKIRIISARKANKRERRIYYDYLRRTLG